MWDSGQENSPGLWGRNRFDKKQHMQYKPLFVGLLIAARAMAQDPEGSWPSYGRDAGGMRYTGLKQINTSNVSGLKPAWTFRTGELKKYEGSYAMEKAAFEATPILRDRTLYFSTPSGRIFALDAASGQQRWVYDPVMNMQADFSEVSNRGVAAWPAGSGAAETIFEGTIDGRLIAVNAATGKPVGSFGNNGMVDLQADAGGEGAVSETSPPAIIGNLVIVGSSLGDNQRFNYPHGVIRAYDVHTGALVWKWDPVPSDPSDSAYADWGGPKARQTGGANAWTILSVDAARDLVFVPTTSPSPDYYGGERLGKNTNANSMVALRASTGKLVWRFQVVHHDLWDFDIASQPMLIELERHGRKIPAVVVGTKMGFIYVLNRETGESLFPIEERKVPASTVKGEQAWTTQPFPVKPAPLGLQNISKADAWGLTPDDKAEAERRIGQYRYEGPFTPPSFEGTIMAPGNVGGLNWSGMCYDPTTEMLYTNINRIAAVVRMLPRDKVDEIERGDAAVLRAETGWQSGTPYVMKRDYLFKADQRGLVMQTQPPWGTLVGIDLHSGDKKWEVPLGFMLDPARWPEAKKWGSINFGGAIVTGGGLIFVAASRDNYFRAFDSRTGATLWEQELPAGGQATPMSYLLDGKQYVVIAAGGHGKLRTKLGDYVVAYALP